jgi:hypothetical protein
MDLKVFYQKVRQVEAGIEEPHVVVISHDTPDGGRAGVASEVKKTVAARMVVEGKARLATAEEAQAFREQTIAAKQAAERHAVAGRMQIAVLSEADLRALKGGMKKG